MIDIDDPRASQIAEVIANETCKKILIALAEDELNQSQISEKLSLALNTIDYNIKKLVAAGLIERVNKTFWSSKGKRIYTYRVSNKRIIISPRARIKGVLPALIASALIAGGIWVWQGASNRQEIGNTPALMKDSSGNFAGALAANSEIARTASDVNIVNGGRFMEFIYSMIHDPNAWAWFFVGAVITLLIFMMWNWVKMKRYNNGEKYE